MPTRRSSAGSAAGQVLRAWRAPRWARGCAAAIALCAVTVFAVGVRMMCIATERGPGAVCGAAGTAYLAVSLAAYAARSRVILTFDAVIVVNMFTTRRVELAEITGVLGMIPCLAILRSGHGRPVFAGAAPLSRWGIGVPLSHSGEIAEALLAAARRRGTRR
ncbi:hypothetical protein KDK95_30230 [Actinospica sp. MGRD01-02]|uniref:PH domain-containing protein n=1 Tax=Actinospica acidithermotolerans TaxID=2828514 RepID=A0A941EH15_9ACTN|nr:hypothetical protein [Actinospica acidithermotolerans]MBR7830618.1 hypothetical protein [Actinospica acidithermotolerans]